MKNLILIILTLMYFTNSDIHSANIKKENVKSTIKSPTILEEIIAFAKIPSVVGREQAAAEFIKNRLGDKSVKLDALGNLILMLGTGEPRRLFIAPLDEPGYVISQIQDDGYLRITPVGSSFSFGGPLAHQYHEGQKIVISTASGPVYGAMTVPSTHLSRSRSVRFQDGKPFTWQNAYIDVGAESSAEVEELGIQMLDPVTLIKRQMVLQNKLIAAPSIQSKAACIALVDAARRLSTTRIKGTVVVAWTVLDLLNGKGLETILNSFEQTFDEAYIFSPTFGFSRQGLQLMLENVPAPGSGLIVDKMINDRFSELIKFQHMNQRSSYLRNPVLKNAKVTHIGLPTRYQKTPVETVHLEDVQKLSDSLVDVVTSDVTNSKISILPLTPSTPIQQAKLPYSELASELSDLIAKYGVSGSEKPVREFIKTLLPSWMNPITDEAGNLTATFGSGEEHVIFIAHMDETGFVVRSIQDDGRLVLRGRPGYSWLWEAQAALVHTTEGDIPAVFEPRKDYFISERRNNSDPLTVYLGVNSSDEAKALGIEVGQTTVTMPKQMHRIGSYRSLARGLDDRAGCAALITVAAQIDPKKLKKRITFAFSTGEEIGLVGARTLAKNFRDATIVYPVDTFVSSDAPKESKINAYCPLGKGAVIRVLESSNFTPKHLVENLLMLTKSNKINVQVGNTFGGTDGGPFVFYEIPSLPISWPGRYSHSPIEVLDFRDLDSLIKLIEVIIVQ